MKSDMIKVLVKMKGMNVDDYEYEFYWNLVLEQYSGIIKNLVKNKREKEDYYHDCILKLPEIISSWDEKKGAFTTHLTWRLRGYIQQLTAKDGVVAYNNTSHKYQAKKKGLIHQGISFTSVDAPIKTEDGSSTAIDYLIPPTLPTVEADLNFLECMSLVDDVEGIEFWREYYLEEKSIKKMIQETGMTRFNIEKIIQAAHSVVVARLRGNV